MRANPLDRLTLAQLRDRTSAKWRVYPDDVLPLWIAEMDAPIAEPIAAALHHAVEIGDTGYAAGTGYAEALAAFAARRWGWHDLPTADVVSVPDVMRGIVEVVKLLSADGDPVVVTAPVYPPFYAFLGSARREVVESPLTAAGRIDLDALEASLAALRPRNSVLLLSNPHNPTGVVHTRDELRAVAELARAHGTRVVVDEIHAPLVLPGAAFTPYLTVPGTEYAVSLMSASKAWNLAGLKAALAIPGPAAVGDLVRLPGEVTHGASHFGVLAHTAALRGGDAWLDDLLTGLAANRELLGALVQQHLPGIGYRPPEGTYLAWLDCRGLAGDPYLRFLERARVALSSGAAFGLGGAGHVRLNFATSAAILTEAVQRMGRAL